jgi:hypothetical protein
MMSPLQSHLKKRRSNNVGRVLSRWGWESLSPAVPRNNDELGDETVPIFPRTILFWLKVLSRRQLKASMTAEDAIDAQLTGECWRRALLWLASRGYLMCVGTGKHDWAALETRAVWSLCHYTQRNARCEPSDTVCSVTLECPDRQE